MLIFISAFYKARCFKPYRLGDPIIVELIRDVINNGVDVSALSLFMDDKGNVYLEKPSLPLCIV